MPLKHSTGERFVILDPRKYPDWDSLVTAQKRSSFFHSSAWVNVLVKTYGHRPLYFCEYVEGHPLNVLPVMEVRSAFMGTFGVSLPFTDSIPSLVESYSIDEALYAFAAKTGVRKRWRYLETRGSKPSLPQANPGAEFYGHRLDLNESAEHLFKRVGDSMRSAISKARRAGVQVEFAQSLGSIQAFYSLHCATRRRHGLPPQPFRFFREIHRNVLCAGLGFVATAYFQGTAIASAVFFHNDWQGIYKFGASDYSFQHLRPNNLLLWSALSHCREMGLSELDLGRTACSNEGLRRFKLRFGAREEKIEYFRHNLITNRFMRKVERQSGWLNRLFSVLPDPFFRLAGAIIYPHIS